MRLLSAAVCCAAALLLLIPACKKAPPEVVVYTALDREFSEPLLHEFTKRTGIVVQAKYDTEATKTVGLVNALLAERQRPRCDVFWNNELLNTVRLQQAGALTPFVPKAAGVIPAAYRDPAGYWTGFAARARVLLINTTLVPAGQEPAHLADLCDARWKGKIGIAKPLFGTTATHAAVLFAALGEPLATAFFGALKDNGVQIEAANSQVAADVAAGRLAIGLTDTDDALEQVTAKQPVRIIYPDAGAADSGVLFIPNTLALVANCPHPDAGKQLIEYLLSPDVEAALAAGPSAQIPLNPAVPASKRVETPATVKAMPADFTKAAAAWDAAQKYLTAHFTE